MKPWFVLITLVLLTGCKEPARLETDTSTGSPPGHG